LSLQNIFVFISIIPNFAFKLYELRVTESDRSASGSDILKSMGR